MRYVEGFENTRSWFEFSVPLSSTWFAFSVVGTSSEILPVGYLKGRYKSESSLMTCEAELQSWVSWMTHHMLTLMGSLKKMLSQMSVSPMHIMIV